MSTKHTKYIKEHLRILCDLLQDEIRDLKLPVDAIQIAIKLGCKLEDQLIVDKYVAHVANNYLVQEDVK